MPYALGPRVPAGVQGIQPSRALHAQADGRCQVALQTWGRGVPYALGPQVPVGVQGSQSSCKGRVHILRYPIIGC